MEVPQGKSAINCYQLKEQHLLHRYKEPCQNYDLMGIVFVYLGNSKVKDQLLNLSRFYKRERFNWRRIGMIKPPAQLGVSKIS